MSKQRQVYIHCHKCNIPRDQYANVYRAHPEYQLQKREYAKRHYYENRERILAYYKELNRTNKERRKKCTQYMRNHRARKKKEKENV